MPGIPGVPSSRPFGVVVVGMHRSGTSAAARLVNLMGFSLGPAEDILPPHPDNPAGYWENASLVSLNDEILLALDCHWSCPRRLEEGWETRPEVDALRPAAAALAKSVLGAARWAWKDPRNCLTLPFWWPVLDQEVAIVLIHRNPLEVAASLREREGFAVPLGLALWERYVRSALAAAEGRPVFVTSYEQLLADPGSWCLGVGDFLRARGVETAAVAPDEVSAVVRPGLRHSIFSAVSLSSDPAVSPEQRQIHAMLETCLGTYDAFAPPELPPETPWVEALLDERRRSLRSMREASSAQAARQDAEARLAAVESSRSYRVLAPLRAARSMLAAARARIRRPG